MWLTTSVLIFIYILFFFLSQTCNCRKDTFIFVMSSLSPLSEHPSLSSVRTLTLSCLFHSGWIVFLIILLFLKAVFHIMIVYSGVLGSSGKKNETSIHTHIHTQKLCMSEKISQYCRLEKFLSINVQQFRLWQICGRRGLGWCWRSLFSQNSCLCSALFGK